ncbi:hypothetical protein SAMD00019534_077550 [Acytostelium subglobosum LB1]|uniref:hypothetical protein n=1 Tax=Acytostelium subglobosum LB1 TaxID=1410327 RepID=UPI0006448FB1|nr:hypothetical protein SAMD00019534_077550 [Acytostelium subglobosum LB1]GAM24580.1 hypothetical protein SAMD00019534_077550 [Acytostelium subglobosum LB1]|eukprot:XP_012752249.1 hypothetical protein SAMD00019534_077550 [Acytostelium subglobosum LB1]
MNVTSSYVMTKRIDARLDSLWDTLQSLAFSYETHLTSQRSVANQYRELHEFLMRDESLLMKTINESLEKTKTSINNIIDEIATINARTTHDLKDYIVVNGDEDDQVDGRVGKLVQTIQSSKSIDQFIGKSFKECDDIPMWGDGQLMDFVRRVSQSTQAIHNVIEPIWVQFDSYHLESGIMELFNKSTIIEAPKQKTEHGFRNHIFSYWNDSCSMLSLDTGEWTVFDDKCTPRKRIFRSVVYARDSVYVFGGEGTPNTYSRFSLIDQKWHNDLEIIGVDGGESISTCYDGDKHIYLVGGFHNNMLLDRVDCFNIDTQQFTSFGKMKNATRSSHTFIHGKLLFVVGGYVDIECTTSLANVWSFNLETKKRALFLKTNFKPEEVLQTCYDGMHHAFIIGDETSLLVELCNERKTNEICLNITDPNLTLINTKTHGLVIVDGAGHNTRYKVLKDKWVSLKDNDPVEDRHSFGTCYIYH